MSKQDIKDKEFEGIARQAYKSVITQLEKENFKVIGNNFFKDYDNPGFSSYYDIISKLVVLNENGTSVWPDTVIDTVKIPGFDVGISSISTAVNIPVHKPGARYIDAMADFNLCFKRNPSNYITSPMDSLSFVITGINKNMYEGKDCMFALILSSQENLRSQNPKMIKELLSGEHQIYTPAEQIGRYVFRIFK